MNLVLVREFNDGHSIIPACIAPVITLLLACGPANISRLIVSIVVDTFDRMGWRWWISDMSIKGFKVLLPWFMQCNSSSSVVRKRNIRGAQATCFNSHPSVMNFRAGHSVCGAWCPASLAFFSSFKTSLFQTFCSITSAGRCFTLLKIIAFNPFDCSAITTAKPMHNGSAVFLSNCFRGTNDKQFAIS